MFNRTFMMIIILIVGVFSSACAASTNHPFKGYERLTNKELDILVYPVPLQHQNILDNKDSDVCLIDKANILKKNPLIVVGVDCFGKGSTPDERFRNAEIVADEVSSRLVELGVKENQMIIFLYDTDIQNIPNVGYSEFVIMANTPDELK